MNPYAIILTESQTPDTLYPFSILHPMFELRCGAVRLFEKVRREFPQSRLFAMGRASQIASFFVRFPDVLAAPSIDNLDAAALETLLSNDLFILNASICLTSTLRETLASDVEKIYASHGLGHPLLFTSNGAPFAVYCPQSFLRKFQASSENSVKTIQETIKELCALQGAPFITAMENALSAEIPEARMMTHLWDALKYSSAAIADDAHYFHMNGTEKIRGFAGVYGMNAENISIGEGSEIAPCVVIDARKGAVIIGNNVEIQPHVSIVGPCYIGDNVLVKAGTRLYEGTSLGEYSKVAGELKNTIFQSYGNKQHEGCLGYSFIGEWVNLGAGTDVSDLKNNYSTIRVRFSPHKAREINTGTTSLGLLAGDHTKSGINTSFNTGTVTGIGANIFEAKPDKYVRSFSWGGLPDSPLFDEEKAIDLARTVMSRRKRALTEEEETLLRAEFLRKYEL